jgi:hypothetical protein
MAGLMLVLFVVAIAAAIAALEVRNLFASFVAAVVGGLAFIVALFVMRAPGVAVLPIIVAGALVWMLLRAGAWRDLKTAPAGRGDLAGQVVGLALVVILLLLTIGVFSEMPKLGEAPFVSIAGSPAATYGSTSFLAVLFSYRILDALGVAALIVGAVLAWLAIRVAAEKS